MLKIASKPQRLYKIVSPVNHIIFFASQLLFECTERMGTVDVYHWQNRPFELSSSISLAGVTPVTRTLRGSRPNCPSINSLSSSTELPGAILLLQ